MWMGVWNEHVRSESVEEKGYYWYIPQVAEHGAYIIIIMLLSNYHVIA